MKSLFLTWLFSIGTLGGVFAQKVSETLDTWKQSVRAERYRKTITSNRVSAVDSIPGKTGLEHRFFGDFQAQVTYFLAPSFGAAMGCRIFRASDKSKGKGSYVLEVRQVSNYTEIEEALEREWPWEAILDSAYRMAQTKEAYDRIIEEAYWTKRTQRIKRYAISELSIPISDSLAQRLYAQTVGLVRYAEAEEEEGVRGMILDGETATFQCTVGGELWSLRFRQPTDDYLRLSDLFRKMIADAQTGYFQEQVYFQQLTTGFAQVLTMENLTVEGQVQYRKTVQPMGQARLSVDDLTDEAGYEKRFFGDSPARVQFFSDLNVASGFRILYPKDQPKDSCTLEVNWMESRFQHRVPDSIVAAGRERMEAYVQARIDSVEAFGFYTVRTVSIPTSTDLAERMYTRTVELLRGTEAVGRSPYPIVQGEAAIFRCIVGDELWSLRFHQPTGDYLLLSDLFKQIISDVQADCFDQTKYLNRLGD